MDDYGIEDDPQLPGRGHANVRPTTLVLVAMITGLFGSRALHARERRRAAAQGRSASRRYTVSFVIFLVLLVLWFVATANGFWLADTTVP
jgi:hypothetical protein